MWHETMVALADLANSVKPLSDDSFLPSASSLPSQLAPPPALSAAPPANFKVLDYTPVEPWPAVLKSGQFLTLRVFNFSLPSGYGSDGYGLTLCGKFVVGQLYTSDFEF